MAWHGEIGLASRGIRFLHNVGLDDIGNQQQNSKPLVLYVEKLKGLPRKLGKPFFVSPVTLFKRTREWIDYGFPPQHQYTFANCEPKDAQVADAAGWMERYAEQFEGRLPPILMSKGQSLQTRLSAIKGWLTKRLIAH